MARRKTPKQHTLKGSVRYAGIALHTGSRVHLSLHPAPAGRGITICRSDLPGQPTFPALGSHVVSVERATKLAGNGAEVVTVEHVLAALYAAGVDNAVVSMDGPEPPLADGSAQPFLELIQEAGQKEQRRNRRPYRLQEPVYESSGETRLILLPRAQPGMGLTCTVAYPTCLLGTQYLSIELTPESFATELAAARTFCEDYGQIASLMQKGLIRGASLDNAVVVKDGAVISKDGLRFENEFVRHKMLDIVGDLSLIGRPLQADVVAVRPGHPINVAAARRVLEHIAEEEG